MELRIGHGYDIHRLVPGRKLILGAVEISHFVGLLGHSDADVVCHAITDALLGALALPNIGQLFPDNDQRTEGIASGKILSEVFENKISGYKINNIDVTIIAEQPKLAPYLLQMRQNIAKILKIFVDQINIKATTHEGLDSIGTQQAIACHAVCLLTKSN